MQKSVKSPANIDAPVNKQGKPFKKKKVIIEQLTEHWSCEIHSLLDKPALCWTPIVQRPHGNCYPITSNVTAQLGLKAVALAWLSTAQAFKIARLGQSHQ